MKRARSSALWGFVSKPASLLMGLLSAWVLYRFLDWAVFQAVFRPDALACQAVGHAGACWGVVVEKARPILLGLDPTDHLGGLPLTLLLAVGAWIVSWPLALALAHGRRSHRVWLAGLCRTWIECVRGVPLIALLFLAAYLLPAVLPPEWQMPLAWRAGMALSLFSAAYLAEIIRSGLQSVPAEQIEAAEVLGLGFWGTQWRVVWPQALRAVLPALVSHAIGLLKDTSLVMVIGLHELTGGLSLGLGGDPVWRPFYLEAYLFVAAVYASLCLGLAWLGRRLEARWQRG